MRVIQPRSKAARNTGIGVVVLLVLLVGGGVAYTYFFGPDGTQPGATVAAPFAAPQSAVKASKPADNAVESVAVQTLSSPVAPGSNTSIAVKTVAGSTCKILVVYANAASTDSGLAPKTADEYGTVGWSWTVGGMVPLGSWPVTVECTYHGRSAVVKADLVVDKEAQ